ncbi:DUF2057 domain-containing protein [Endozoicomonas sp. Mp262]|uniref:YccT family protein n=1 Tax=Endozoicomonas sp. Mp262 TaxID=2919499 RepID=UPI0021DAA396
MLIRRLLGVAALAVISISAFAGSAPDSSVNYLKLPDQAELLIIDGKDARDQNVNKREGVRLADGKHQVVFQFKALLKGTSDSAMYTSDPYVVSFGLNGSQQYQLTVPRKFRSIRDAEAFAKAPAENLVLLDSHNKQIPYQVAVLKKRGIQLGRDLVEETRKFNLSSDPAALYSLTGGTMVSSSGSSRQLPAVQGENKEMAVLAENNLKYWFMQADKETRARFLKWANQQ